LLICDVIMCDPYTSQVAAVQHVEVPNLHSCMYVCMYVRMYVRTYVCVYVLHTYVRTYL
jgi:hypothetical protein